MSPFVSRLATALLVAATLFASSLQAQQLQPIDSIVAVVDEQVILQSELDQAMRNVRSQYAGREEMLPPVDVLKKQVLDRLILVRLQVARAEAAGLQVSDAEIDQAVANIAAQNGGSVAQLNAQLVADGLTMAGFRNSLRDELLIQRLRQSLARSRIMISEAEVEAALATQTGNATQYRLAHILVALPEGATADQIATGQRKIEGVQGLIERGEMTFAAAAVRYSDSPNALEGGDLGWRSADEIPAAFAATVAQMSPGQMIGPLRGPSGFQLLQLVDVRDASQAGPQTVTEVQARHILIRIDDTTSIAEAKAQIDTLRARLAGGADFAQLARESSEDANTSGQGGDLGWFQPNAFGPDFGAQVSALQDGAISQSFRTAAGWHIVQRIDTRQRDVAQANRRAQVRAAIGQRKLEAEWNRFLREMRGEAYIDVRLDDSTQAPAAAPDDNG